MPECISVECSNEAKIADKFCGAHAKLFDNVNEIGKLKDTIRKRNLMIKQLRKQSEFWKDTVKDIAKKSGLSVDA